MFASTDLIEPLAQRGIGLSSSQAYQLVVDRPERLSVSRQGHRTGPAAP